MKFALVNESPQEAFVGGKGLCRSCGGDVIAKCGSYRLHHWAHKGSRECDSWAEKETEWHRAWKDKFSRDSQEVIQFDDSGEKHIADIRTQHGLVIEFQHSHLQPQERATRERFYKNMVWVVDGTRLQRDYPRFFKGKNDFQPIAQGYFSHSFIEECFPALWLNSSVPVIFDFLGNETDSADEWKNGLWCLFPGRALGKAVVARLSRSQFVEIAPTRPILLDFQQTMENFRQHLHELRAAEESRRMSQLMANRMNFQRRRSRRF